MIYFSFSHQKILKPKAVNWCEYQFNIYWHFSENRMLNFRQKLSSFLWSRLSTLKSFISLSKLQVNSSYSSLFFLKDIYRYWFYIVWWVDGDSHFAYILVLFKRSIFLQLNFFKNSFSKTKVIHYKKIAFIFFVCLLQRQNGIFLFCASG